MSSEPVTTDDTITMEKVPSLDQMIQSTIQPMIKSTGNEVDMDTFLNTETELRQRTNVLSVSPGKIKLSLTYNNVSHSDLQGPLRQNILGKHGIYLYF